MLSKRWLRVLSVILASGIFGVPLAHIVTDLSGYSGLGAFLASVLIGVLAAFRPDAALLVGPIQQNADSGNVS